MSGKGREGSSIDIPLSSYTFFSSPLFDFTPWAWRNMNGICITQKQRKNESSEGKMEWESCRVFWAHRSGREWEWERGTSLFTVQYMARDHVSMLERWQLGKFSLADMCEGRRDENNIPTESYMQYGQQTNQRSEKSGGIELAPLKSRENTNTNKGDEGSQRR